MTHRRCEILSCTNTDRSNPGMRFFAFPKDSHLQAEWNALCGEKRVKYRHVCQEHFDKEAWSMQDRILNVPLKKRLLAPGAVPTMNLGRPPTTRGKRPKLGTSRGAVVEALSGNERLEVEKPRLNNVDSGTQTWYEILGNRTEIKLYY